jgi:cobalt-zinc-cadmium efflux system protein
MSHHHPTGGAATSRKLLIASIATAAFVVVEIVIGIRANSLALIGDALHNITDTLALLLALFAVRVERRPATSAKSYGWHRAGVLAAFINAGALAAFTIFLFVEAAQRLRAPASVNSGAMLITAAAALVLNGAITLWLLGDAISSAGIIAAALLIRRTGALFWDPAVSIAIGVLILWSSWGILREAINLLLEGTPEGIDPEAVTRAIAALDGVDGVHHLHIWALGASRPALSCHLMVGDIPVRSTGNLLARVNAMLEREYGITHTTIQFEFATCDVDDPYCVPYGE